MKVGQTSRIGTSAHVSRTKKPSSGGSVSGAGSIAPGRSIADTVAVMGLSSEEMTPKAREAIMSLMAEVDSLRRDLETAKKRLEHMEKLADLDPLIPVFNRRAFVREISRMISFAERYSTPSSLVYLDLNNMKEINDTHGHAAGDAALVHVGESLRAYVRDTDVVGRLGGDEFGVLLAHMDEQNAAAKALELSSRIAAAPVEYEGRRIAMEMAYGVHNISSGDNASDALAAADRRMYEHKRANKG